MFHIVSVYALLISIDINGYKTKHDCEAAIYQQMKVLETLPEDFWPEQVFCKHIPETRGI